MKCKLWILIVLTFAFVSCGKVEEPKKMTLKEVNSKDVILPVYEDESIEVVPGETKKVPLPINNSIAVTRKFKIAIEPDQPPEGWVIAVCEGEACYPFGLESEIKGMSKKIYNVSVQAPEEATKGQKVEAYFVFNPINEPEQKVKVKLNITVK
jgi:hypothetical protein